jgi:protein-disulfide isomerase
MASRTRQKEEARARRLAEERARELRERQQRRLRMVGGIVLGAVAVVAVLVAISIGGGSHSNAPPAPTSAVAKADAATVSSELSGISQSGNRLGPSTAHVTVTEFGDLQCPVCRDFALGSEKQLIQNDVRAGNVQLIYRSLETATGNDPNPSIFGPQQAAALAAGLQGHEWDYILLFYYEQGGEGSGYVTDSYQNGLAKQIPGLNYAKWLSDRASSSLTGQVTADQQQAQVRGFNSTPTIVVQGPKGQAPPLVGDQSYSTIEAAIKAVS